MLKGGYTGKLLRIDLSKKEIITESLDEKLLEKYLGGRGLGARLIFEELAPKIDALSPENKLYILTGPLQGTLTPFTPKCVVVSKSPLTGTFTRALCGGHFIQDLKYAGYDGIVIEGKAEKPVYIWIDDTKVTLKDATHLWGKTTGQTERMIKKEIGDDTVKVASIGPGGERCVRFASIISSSRAAARGGCGAVMGSKNLKAIAIRGKGEVKVANLDLFKKILEEAYLSIKADPAAPFRIKYGTTGTVAIAHKMGIMPVRNYSTGVFEGIENIKAESMRERIVIHDESCFACPLPCGKLSLIREGPYAGTSLEGPQYETIGLLGSNCGIDNIETIAKANQLCNELGIDTISTGNVIAFAMECYERGLITKEDTDGIELKFGSGKALVELVKKIGKREGFGDRLAEGVKRLSTHIGGGSDDFAMHVKGQELASFEPRSIVGMGLLFATANTGANHSLGPTFRQEMENPLSPQGKAEILVAAQNDYCLMDSMIFCSFSRYGLDMKFRFKFFSAVTGFNIGGVAAAEIANRIYTLERAFNVREGFTRSDDSLPPRSLNEPIPEGPSKGNVVPLKEMLDEYYRLRGWDSESGIPTRKTLEDVGLKDVADELKEQRYNL